jgi:hypothetical protein
MQSIRLSYPQGDDGKVGVHVVASDGDSIDLSSFSQITFTLKRSVQDADSEAIFQGTLTGGNISLLNPVADGDCEVTIPRAYAATLMIGREYYWTVKLTSGTGSVSTPAYGTLLTDSPIQRGN